MFVLSYYQFWSVLNEWAIPVKSDQVFILMTSHKKYEQLVLMYQLAHEQY